MLLTRAPDAVWISVLALLALQASFLVPPSGYAVMMARSAMAQKTAIHRFDISQPGTSLTATNDWNLTADLPVVGANLGIEAVTWIPDAFLVSQSFFDESRNHTYLPADYPGHGDGLFFVFSGVEDAGQFGLDLRDLVVGIDPDLVVHDLAVLDERAPFLEAAALADTVVRLRDGKIEEITRR